MPSLNDERVPQKKSNFELNQEAIMESLTKLASALGEMNAKINALDTRVTDNHNEVIKWVKAGRFTG